MTDLISEGLAWLAEETFAYIARPVEYRRHGEQINILAMVGKLRTELPETENTTVAYTGRRFWIRSADLDFGRGPESPQRGDEIVLGTPDGHKAIYQVTSFPPGQSDSEYLIEIMTTYSRTE